MRVHVLHESFKLSRPGGRWENACAEVAIVGLGLVGGSVGLGLQDFGYAVGGWDTDESAVDLAIQRGAINGRFDSLEEVGEASLVILAVPPDTVVPTLAALAPFLGPETVVTDCASVKAEIVNRVQVELPDFAARFVGGHPMAGLHVGGIANAAWNMFEGAAWVLTPLPSTDREAFSRVNQMVNGLGARVFLMDPEEHDRHVALLSHLPHVLAAKLMQEAQGLAYPQVGGGSWRDLTRVAGADPQLWTEITMQNRVALGHALRELSKDLGEAADLVEEGNPEEIRWLFEAAREAKRKAERPR